MPSCGLQTAPTKLLQNTGNFLSPPEVHGVCIFIVKEKTAVLPLRWGKKSNYLARETDSTEQCLVKAHIKVHTRADGGWGYPMGEPGHWFSPPLLLVTDFCTLWERVKGRVWRVFFRRKTDSKQRGVITAQVQLHSKAQEGWGYLRSEPGPWFSPRLLLVTDFCTLWERVKGRSGGYFFVEKPTANSGGS